jgi:hypothetical protein
MLLDLMLDGTHNATWYSGGVSLRAISTSLLVVLAVTGCHKSASTTAAAPTPQQKNEQRAEREMQREQLDMIPPPAKTRFMVIHSFDSWDNPWLTVQDSMITIHVLRADENPSASGAGGLLRPRGARKEDVSVAPEKLADAVAAIPQSAWPYGRVVAIEEAHKVPAAQEPAVRRTMEAAMSTLNDLGVSVYDPVEGKVQ